MDQTTGAERCPETHREDCSAVCFIFFSLLGVLLMHDFSVLQSSQLSLSKANNENYSAFHFQIAMKVFPTMLRQFFSVIFYLRVQFRGLIVRGFCLSPRRSNS